jgi:hypothetical protein
MTDAPANLTDAAICRLLAAGPAPTVALAARLGVPERTVRHRLYRLRQTGVVVDDSGGLHWLTVPVTAAPIAGRLPPPAVPVVDLAVPVPATLAAGPLPARAAPAVDLVAPVPSTVAAGPLPARAAPVVDLVASVTAAPITGPLPARAAPAMAPDHPASDGSSPRHGGHSRARTVLAAGALGLAVAGAIAVEVRMRRMSPPPSPAPAPPTWSGDAGDPWGWMRGPTW